MKGFDRIGSVRVRLLFWMDVSKDGLLIEVVDADLVFVAVDDKRVGEEVESRGHGVAVGSDVLAGDFHLRMGDYIEKVESNV